jgi:pimeloyl-ACP methyl ester carboxylesterase
MAKTKSVKPKSTARRKVSAAQTKRKTPSARPKPAVLPVDEVDMAAPFSVGSGPAGEPAIDSVTDSLHAQKSREEQSVAPKAQRFQRPWDDDEKYHLQLPFEGELKPAVHRRFRETVVFVHHFGGTKKSLARHVSAVNKLGFDAVVFNLIFGDTKPKDCLPITADLKFGTRHVWAEQIEAILNSVPGRKIVFSFSMPSASALAAIAHRSAKDVAAWVCDGGPFLDLPRCVWNLYKHEYEVKSDLVRGVFTGLSLVLFGLGFEREVKGLLQALPAGFPVLSIRGWSDPLVAPAAIDHVFEQQTHLDLEMLSFGDGRHLDGLKRFPEQYMARLEKFLDPTCTPI